ncbi:MAG: adenylosuccinate lyase [Pirellulaceae bacterium]|nr:adenylosuccinate lyase [Pirellulaceae bacterium]MDP7015635.1 adenylosuccinate lyase [Pirellulaceae bacterium]
MSAERYENPLVTRYASNEMSALWSAQRKFGLWRRLWLALAEAEAELGIDITAEQLGEMRAHLDDIDFERAAFHEKAKRHDVMAHIETFGEAAPGARPIMHLGATSCFVTDNADLILLRDALDLTSRRLAVVIDQLARFAESHRDLPCLGFTHLQPAQPTTVGKRACLWAYDFALDLAELEHRQRELRARSTKGTTGTQASFLSLFGGDHERVRRLEQLVAEKIGFDATYAVTGQTYSRKIDSQIVDVLSGVAQSAHKLATDIRLLAHRKEVEEPFGKQQVGSSAMPYKRNPMKSERVCSLARYVSSLQTTAANTLSTQWMERTLDDSACRRIYLPQAFLAIDAILVILNDISSGLVTYPAVISRNLRDELPFMATENIMMEAVQQGGDRQDLHERIRRHAQAAGAVVKSEGKDNDLLIRLRDDPAFAGVNIDDFVNPADYVGRAPEQVDQFLSEVVQPIRDRYAEKQPPTEELRV